MLKTYSKQLIHQRDIKKGRGVLNRLINKLPFELHIPGYNFCGPGTKLDKRIARGDKGINALDEACKEHDLAYSKFEDINRRHEADKVLEEQALKRFRDKKASFGERTAALGITGAMKAKRKFGMGLRKRKQNLGKGKKRYGKGIKKSKRKHSKKGLKGRGLSLTQAIAKARKAIKGKKFKSLKTSIKTALNSIPKGVRVSPPKKRVIPIPKSGGFLPLIPLFAGLSALDALGGGAAGIAKAVNDAKAASQKLEESKRHNKTMEAIALGKRGNGLYLKPFKTGCGLYLKPYSKNC